MPAILKKLLAFTTLFAFLVIGFTVSGTKNPANAQSASCTFTVNYTDGTTGSGLEIITTKDFSININVSRSGIYGVHWVVLRAAGGGFEKDRSPNGLVTGVNINRSELFSGESGPATDDSLIINIYEGSSSKVCETEFKFVSSTSSCTGNLEKDGNTLKTTVNGCRDKRARVEVHRPLGNKRELFNRTVTSNTWGHNVDISSYTKDWDNANLYICESSEPNCNNLVDTVGIRESTAGCPSFATFNPTPPEPNVLLQVQYIPLSGYSPSDFKVRVVQDGSGSTKTLTAAFGRWVTTIGTFPSGSAVKVHLFPASADVDDIRKACDRRDLSFGVVEGIGENPCIGGECKTAIGNIPIKIKQLADKILKIALGIAGGIALILIVIGSIRVLVSSGDQQKLNGGREMIVAAVAGLIFLAFATLILEFIGLNILGGVAGI